MDRGFDLYQRYLEGDEKALDDLIKIYRCSLTAFINGFVKDYNTAESIMIDVFVELIRNKNFKGRSSLKTYLFTLGRNKALRHIKYNRHDFISIEDVENHISGEELLLDKIVEEERRKMVHEAMSELKPIYREALYLIYFEEMSYNEASLILHKSSKQIANIIYRAKQSLKNHLDERMKYYEQNE